MNRLNSSDRAGLYVTVIFHLAVLIVLLLVKISSLVQSEKSFVMDFSRTEQQEQLEKEQIFRDRISQRLDELIEASGTVPADAIRNIAVDAGSALKDDRNSSADADELYKEAARLAEDLKTGRTLEDARNETVELPDNREKPSYESEKKAYSGPSVLSWTLDGRKASSLKIPAYKCYGAGDVSVMIKVHPDGRVLYVKIIDAVSSTDPCLRDFAVRAARTSRFSMSDDPAHSPNEIGEITYRFIAQQ